VKPDLWVARFSGFELRR